MPQNETHIAIVDDHELFRKGLVSLVLSFDTSYHVDIEANNGKAFLEKLRKTMAPDIAIMDMNMPKMDGYELAKHLKRLYPSIKLLVISMFSSEETIIRMLRMGVKGYLSKDINPTELKKAIRSIRNGDYHYTDFVTGQLLDTITKPNYETNKTLNEREIQFLQYACSEDTYQQIADKMYLSVKTIDGYRANLFDKLSVKSRTGLVLYGIRSGLVNLE